MVDLAQILDREGAYLEGKVVQRILSGVPPPNAPSTILRKKSTKTLVDTGDMVGSVSHRVVVDQDVVRLEVGIFDPAMIERATTNEFGVPSNDADTEPKDDQRIPTRSFLRYTFDREIDSVVERLEKQIARRLEEEFGK